MCEDTQGGQLCSDIQTDSLWQIYTQTDNWVFTVRWGLQLPWYTEEFKVLQMTGIILQVISNNYSKAIIIIIIITERSEV